MTNTKTDAACLRTCVEAARVAVGALLLFCLLAAPTRAGAEADLDRCRQLIVKGRESEARRDLVLLERDRNPAVAREAAFLLGDLEIRSGRASTVAAGRRRMEALTTSDTDAVRARAIRYLAQLECNSGDAEAAVRRLSLFLKAERSTPEAVMAAELLGDMHRQNGDKASARQAYQYALQLCDELTREGGPCHTEGLPKEVSRKRIAAKVAQPKASRKRPPLPEEERLFRAAEQARQNRRFQDAISLYRKLGASYPDSALVHPAGYRIGCCLLEAGNVDAAEEHWTAFVAAAPTGAWRGHAHVGLGNLLLRYRFDAEAALAQFSRVVNAADTADWSAALADACEGAGICLLMAQKYEAAEKLFTREMGVRPERDLGPYKVPSQMRYLRDLCVKREHPVPLPGRVMTGRKAVQTAIFLASCYSECGTYDASMALLERLADGSIGALTPTQAAFVAYERAEVLRLQDKSDLSRDAFDACATEFRRTPFAPKALLGLAQLHFLHGENDAGEAVCRRLWTTHRTSPEAATALFACGDAYYVSGMPDQARALFAQLLREHPRSWEAQFVREKIWPDLEKQKR